MPAAGSSRSISAPYSARRAVRLPGGGCAAVVRFACPGLCAEHWVMKLVLNRFGALFSLSLKPCGFVSHRHRQQHCPVAPSAEGRAIADSQGRATASGPHRGHVGPQPLSGAAAQAARGNDRARRSIVSWRRPACGGWTFRRRGRRPGEGGRATSPGVLLRPWPGCAAGDECDADQPSLAQVFSLVPAFPQPARLVMLTAPPRLAAASSGGLGGGSGRPGCARGWPGRWRSCSAPRRRARPGCSAPAACPRRPPRAAGCRWAPGRAAAPASR